ncbi:uncharacterized protein LOC144120195, partial [Amblyomma americanum]
MCLTCAVLKPRYHEGYIYQCSAINLLFLFWSSCCRVPSLRTDTWCQKWPVGQGVARSAMDLLKPPEPLQLSGNLSQNWKRFKQKLELFIKATTPKDDPRSGAAKAALLLSVAGDEALDVFNTFTFGEQEDKEDYDTLVRKFEAYCAEVSNEVHERYVFRSRKQEDGEPFERFIRDLKKQAAQCNFEGLHDSMIRDQIVFGTNNSKLREKMLREKGLTLLKAEEMCRVAESVAQRNQVWARPGASIDSVSRSRASCHRCVDRQETSAVNGSSYRCKKCNRRHEPRQCPAYGKRCNTCRKLHHFAICCPARALVNEVGAQFNDEFDVLDVCIDSCITGDWTVEAKVGGRKALFKVDTGAQASLLPFSIYRKLKTAELNPTSSVLRAYNGGIITNFGTTVQKITVGDAATTVKFYVVKNGRRAILGLHACEALGLVQRTVDTVNTSAEYEAIKHFRHVFEGLGCLKQPYSMVLQPDATPVVQPARRVPLSLRQPLRDELQRMERAGIITKEDGPTDWYVPGKHLVLADMLSRSTTPGGVDNAGATEDVEVHALQLLNGMVTVTTQQKLAKETARDCYLQTVVSNLSAGSPIQGELKP